MSELIKKEDIVPPEFQSTLDKFLALLLEIASCQEIFDKHGYEDIYKSGIISLQDNM
jgi:hypothetical protein